MYPSLPESAPLIALPWIIRLRVALAVSAAALVGVARFLLDLHVPVGPMLGIAAVIALSNLPLWYRGRKPGDGAALSNSNLVALVFVLDIACLTALLMLSGGPSNPFSLLYLVHVTLSATILTKRWTWFFGFLATLCFGLLFVAYRAVPELELHHHGTGPDLHLIGMWAPFAVAAFLVALFSGKISEQIREHEVSRRAMQAELARKDRLASLVTLAAGAAHELGTPLGTIAIVAKDLEIYAAGHIRDNSLAEDCRLIRAEVNRCQAILANMSIQGAEPMGEAYQWTTPADLMNQLLPELSGRESVEVSLSPEALDAPLHLPARAVRQALLALVRNALESGSPLRKVRLSLRRDGRYVLVEVADQGHGMTADQLRRVGEPFFTTKAPGEGMGLGVFLVRILADQVGAELNYRSSPSAGTTATLRLPIPRQELQSHASR
jgi:two-component system sensor histidine kinase RegB